MKKVLFLCVALGVGVLSVFAGGTGETAGKSTPVILASHMNPGGPENLAMLWMAEQLEQRSKGLFKTETYESGVLGNEPELMEQVRSEQVHVHFAGSSSQEKYMKGYMVCTVPFMLQGNVLDAVYSGKIGLAVNEVLAKNNFVLFGYCLRGNRQLTTKKEVRSPKDLSGMKMRLPENQVWMDVWKELGALPTPISGNETFSALQTGVVDAQENPTAANYQKSLWEVQKYTIMTNHVYDHFLLVSPKKWFDSLPTSLQNVFSQVVTEGAQRASDLSKELETKFRKEMEAKGMIFIDAIDLKPFREKALPAIERAARVWEPWVYEELQKILGN